MRPTALGQEYMSYSMVLSFGALCIHLVELLKSKEGYITKKNFIVLVSSLVLWSYLVVHALLMSSNNFDDVLKAGISHIVVIFIFSIILSREKENTLFFKWFIKILGLFSFSFVLTVLLGLVVGFQSLYLFEIPIATYNHSQLFYFPFTSLSSFMVVSGIEFPRFLGLFREPGILQAFLIWAYFNLKQYGLETKKMKVLLFAGIVGTMSTAGIAIFFGTVALKYALNRKVIKGVLLVIFCITALNYAPIIGLQYKAETHGASLDARSYATLSGLEKMRDNPLGTGMYNRDFFDYELSGINLLASSYMIGVIGVLLTLVVYLLPLWGYPNKVPYIVGITPLLITLLYSQPILDAPLVYIMLLASYKVSSFVAETDIVSDKNKVRKKRLFKRYKLTW